MRAATYAVEVRDGDDVSWRETVTADSAGRAVDEALPRVPDDVTGDRVVVFLSRPVGPDCEGCTRTDTGPASVVLRASKPTYEGGVVVDRQARPDQRLCWACAFPAASALGDEGWDVELRSDSGRVWREIGR